MPVRLLKPKLRTSRKWNACSYQAQSAYVRLLMIVDDAGRYFGHPKILASELFPLGGPRGEDVGTIEMETWLKELVNAKLVETYDSDGDTFLQLTTWEERIRTVSRFPESPSSQALLAFAGKCAQMNASPPTPTPTPTPELLPAALNTDAFKEAWEHWLAYRKARRLPTMTPQTLKLQFRMLAKLGPALGIQSIEQSIMNGWQGLFEPKQSYGNKTNQPNPRNIGIARAGVDYGTAARRIEERQRLEAEMAKPKLPSPAA